MNILSVRQVSLTILPVIVLFLNSATSSNPQNQVAQTCAAGSHPANVVFSIIDESGNVPTDVTKDDLTLKVNNEITPVSAIDLQVGTPLDLAVLIDVSVSQEESLGVTKPVAKALIQEVLRAPINRVALLSFSNEIEVEQPLTNDVSKLLAALDSVKVVIPPGYVAGGIVVGPLPTRRPSFPGATSLWDTSARALERIYGSVGDPKRRRAVILLSDGVDTSSKGKISTSIDSAIACDVAIYAIGVAGRDNTLDRGALRKVSEQTGGTAAFPKNREELKIALLEISKRLGSQYIISFCRAGDEHYKLRLDLKNPKLQKAQIAYPRERS